MRLHHTIDNTSNNIYEERIQKLCLKLWLESVSKMLEAMWKISKQIVV